MRTKTPMLKDRPYCKKCMIALIPGHNCRIRLRSDRVVVHCLSCRISAENTLSKGERGEQNGQERNGTDRKRQRPQAKQYTSVRKASQRSGGGSKGSGEDRPS